MRCKDLFKRPLLPNIVILVIFATVLIAGKEQQIFADEPEEQTQEPIWRRTFAKRLKEIVSYSFEDEPLKDVLETFRKNQHLNIILDTKGRGVNPEIRMTFHFKKVRFESVLSWTARLAGLDYAIQHQAIFITRAENMVPEWRKEVSRRKKNARIQLLEKFLPRLREKFIEPVTMDIDGAHIQEALAELSRLGDVNILYLSDTEARLVPVTFKVEMMTLENAFEWLLRLEGLEYLIIDEAIVVGRPGLLARWKNVGLLLEGVPPLAQAVSFTFVDEPLREALEELQKMSGVKITLEGPEEINPPVTIKAENLELLAAVRIILSRLDLDYALTTSPQKDAINVLIREKKAAEETVVPLPEEEESPRPESQE